MLCFIVLSADLLYKQQRHSWYCEPAKSDYPKDKFRQFAYGMYDKQLLIFRKCYEKTQRIPAGFVWNPQNVNQKKSNSLYMHLETLLLAIMCIHCFYKHLNINIHWLMKNFFAFGKLPSTENINIRLKKPIKARRIKQLKFKSGATNAVTITKGDFGFTKPCWFNANTGKHEHYNQYGRVVGVE